MTFEELTAKIKEADQNEMMLPVSLFVADMNLTNELVMKSDDQVFSYLSNYFYEITSMTNSKEFTENLKDRFIKMHDTTLDLEYINGEIMAACSLFESEEY